MRESATPTSSNASTLTLTAFGPAAWSHDVGQLRSSGPKP